MIRKIQIWAVLFFLPFFAHAQFDGTDYFEWGRQMELISSVIKQMMNNYVETPNPEKMGTDAIKGMLSNTDRYTRFYDEQQMFEQRLRQSGKVSGIGVRIRSVDEGLQVREVMHDTPARKAGLMPGDIITVIDGQALKNLTASQKDKLIAGEPHSTVKLHILRGKKQLDFTVKRQIIEQKAVTYTGLLPDGTGYIHLRKFTRTAANEVKEALVDLKEQGAKRIVLDLRNNPGGLLSQAIGVVNLFVPKGKPVVQTRGRFEKFNRSYYTKKEPVDENIPLYLWINNRSASASEIVSGTLQDYDRATIIGDTSYGKGLVQRFFPLKYGTYIKITISKYYLPSGRLIQKRDYWHRDSHGHTTRFAKNNKKFHTQGGRTVYEHGGITPDRYVPSDTLLPVVKTLWNKDRFFAFFTDYLRTRPAPAKPEDLNENDLALEFAQYLQKNDIALQSDWTIQVEKALEKAREHKASAGEINTLEKSLKELQNALQKSLSSVRGQQQTGIILKRMFIQHYFGNAEAVKYDLHHTPLIKYVK